MDSCYREQGTYASGYPTTGADVLTSGECFELLQLDPFYGVGQSNTSIATNPRFKYATQSNYGVDPTGGGAGEYAWVVGNTVNNTVTTTVQNVGSYTATVTDVLSSTDNLNATANLFGLSLGDAVSRSETKTQSSNWTATLTSSQAATAQSSTTLTATLDDSHGANGSTAKLPAYPVVVIYRDTMFGSFLFVDPAAPAAP